jgi:hypothetical protein
MLVSHHPAPLGGLVIEVEFVAEFPQMLPGMIEIYDFDGAGELLRDDVPDPIGTVAHHHFLLRPTPATLMSFGVGAAGELAGNLDGSGGMCDLEVTIREFSFFVA